MNIVNGRLFTLFKEHMPDTLYLNHYELSDRLGHSPDLWEELLDDTEVKRFVESKIAKLAEYQARKALKRLGDTDINSQEVQALRQLLEKSKLLQQRQNQHQHIVLTHIPKRTGSETNENRTPTDKTHDNET